MNRKEFSKPLPNRRSVAAAVSHSNMWRRLMTRRKCPRDGIRQGCRLMDKK